MRTWLVYLWVKRERRKKKNNPVISIHGASFFFPFVFRMQTQLIPSWSSFTAALFFYTLTLHSKFFMHDFNPFFSTLHPIYKKRGCHFFYVELSNGFFFFVEIKKKKRYFPIFMRLASFCMGHKTSSKPLSLFLSNLEN